MPISFIPPWSLKNTHTQPGFFRHGLPSSPQSFTIMPSWLCATSPHHHTPTLADLQPTGHTNLARGSVSPRFISHTNWRETAWPVCVVFELTLNSHFHEFGRRNVYCYFFYFFVTEEEKDVYERSRWQNRPSPAQRRHSIPEYSG